MRQLRRIFTAVLVLLGVVVVVPAFAGLASAHHSNISASVACSGTVTWTATSWSTGAQGTNSDILVTKTIGTTTTTIQHGAFNAADNYQFSGTFAWPASTSSITISSKPIAAWGNGNTSKVGSSTTISKPTNCAGQPGVAKAVSCVNTSAGHGDGRVVVTLTNNAGQFASAVVFKVYNPDQTASFTNYTVATGATTPVTFNGLTDGSHTVKILVGTADYSQSFTVDCDSAIPAVNKSVTCVNGDGQIVVTLGNTGGKSVVFDVTNPKTAAVEHITVAADSSTTRTFSGFADGSYTVVITVGTADYSQAFTVDCDHPIPSASATSVCDNTSHDGNVTITLKNTGTEAVVFHVTNPFTNVVTDVPVGIGATVLVPFNGFTDGAHTVVITADGQTLTQTFTVACDLAPTFSHAETCVSGDGSVSVTMKNDGDDVNATFVLNGTTYTLAPGATQTVTIGALTDGPHSIPLTINGVDKTFDVTVDCDRPGQPAVEISQTCATEDGVVVVTLKNIGGQLPLTFTVQGASYSVPADSSVPVTVSGLLDGDQVIQIFQGATDLSKPVTVHCDLAPTVSSTQKCVDAPNGIADGQVIVTLTNNGDDVPVTFTVNGVATTVAPKTSTPVTVGPLTDGTHTIDVFVGQVRLGLDSITVACDHPGTGTISTAATCVDNDGQVTITLIATGGELPVVFTVNGTPYSVAPNTTTPVVISGLNDGPTTIAVSAGATDLSFLTTTHCDLAPTSSFSQACASTFDDTVTVTISNPGDDVDVTFTINGTDYVLHPGETLPVVIANLADGTNTITLAINGVPQDNIVVQSHCAPVFSVAAVCNSVDVNGVVTGYWFNVTNTESTDVTVGFNGGGTITVPAGQTVAVQSPTAPLVLTHNGATIATTPATEAVCQRTVTFTKELDGQPATGETYTIQVSRLVNGAYVPDLTFAIKANETKTITLPSTLDPAGVNYKIDEINAGSANTSTITPSQLTLAGHLGETVAVVITNGYASIQIDKTTSNQSVVPGGQITYTLQATNTGGLTLNPYVIVDRLPSMVSVFSASVAGGAGSCTLTESARPQLLTCDMTGALAPGAVSAVVTVVVDVDATAVAGSTIVNQAMVHGAYSLGTAITGAGTEGPALSCIPVQAGTVCDLSAQVGVPVGQSQVASSPPVPTPPVGAAAQLPRTGAEHIQQMLALSFGGVLVGGALLLIGRRRRIGVR
ncbi:MAG: LPXTG cell wall anchor domain-containing protein [Ilumatobacteraceae bacterium]